MGELKISLVFFFFFNGTWTLVRKEMNKKQFMTEWLFQCILYTYSEGEWHSSITAVSKAAWGKLGGSEVDS